MEGLHLTLKGQVSLWKIFHYSLTVKASTHLTWEHSQVNLSLFQQKDTAITLASWPQLANSLSLPRPLSLYLRGLQHPQTLACLPSCSGMSGPLWKALLCSQWTLTGCTSSTGSVTASGRSGWRCSGPEPLLSWPWAVPWVCETGPGHERTASCHPHGPVTSDDWQPLPASLHGPRAVASRLHATQQLHFWVFILRNSKH